MSNELNLNVVCTCPVIIREAYMVEECVYPDSDHEVCIVVEDESGNQKHWIGSFSQNYGKGNFSDRTQTQITLGKLKELGLESQDLTQLESLVGVQTTATTKESVSGKDGKTYINVSYLAGGGSKPKAMDASQVALLAKQIAGTDIAKADVIPPVNPFAPKA